MREIVFLTFSTFFGNIVDTVSLLLSALIIIVFGILLGKIVSRIVEEILEKFKIENYLFGKKVIGFSSLFSMLIAVFIYLVFMRIGIEVMNIGFLARLLEDAINFMVKLIVFVIQITVGLWISFYIKKKIEESNIEFRLLIAKVLYYMCVYIVIVLTLPVLGIDTSILTFIFLIAFIVIVLPFSISLSLILKDELRPVIRKYLRKEKIKKKRK